MSEKELYKEIENIYETMKNQNKGEVREKLILALLATKSITKKQLIFY